MLHGRCYITCYMLIAMLNVTCYKVVGVAGVEEADTTENNIEKVTSLTDKEVECDIEMVQQ